MSNKVTPGTQSPPANYSFNQSGLPDDISYMGNISVSAGTNDPYIVVGDLGAQEFGRLPLSDVGTANLFTIRAPLTANASTATLEPQEVRISLRDSGGASSLVFFVKTSLGNSLSGSVSLGPTI